MSTNQLIHSITPDRVSRPDLPDVRPYHEIASPYDRFTVKMENGVEVEVNPYAGLEIMVPTKAGHPDRRLGARVVTGQDDTSYLLIEAAGCHPNEFLRNGNRLAYDVESMRQQLASTRSNGLPAEIIIGVGRSLSNPLVLSSDDSRASGSHGEFFVKQDDRGSMVLGYRDHSSNGTLRPDYQREQADLNRQQKGY